MSSENLKIEEMELIKSPWGEVTLVGLGRLGLRTALNLLQIHRGGPSKITAIDGQKISPDDIIFKMINGQVGEYKVNLVEKLAGNGFSRQIVPIPKNITQNNLDLIQGDVVCVEIAGGDTLPITASMIKKAHSIGALTISTMGVFGLGEEEIKVLDISQADPSHPIVQGLKKNGINNNHLLIGTGKLIRDWEPVTPYMLDRLAAVITSEILKLLEKKK